MWVLTMFLLLATVIFYRGRRSGWNMIDYLGLGIVYIYARLWHRWSSNGMAPLPTTGPVLLVSNHTCSADPAFLAAGCSRRLGYILAREFHQVVLLHRFFVFIGCVPATRNGRDFQAVRESLRRLEEGRILCIFPEGGLSHAGRNRVGTGKHGIALIALRSQVPVYPAYIQGGPRTSNVANAWLRPSRGVYVTFGAALDLSNYHDRPINRRLLEEVTQFVMKRIVELKN